MGSEVFAEDIIEKICNAVHGKAHALLEEYSGKKYTESQTQKLSKQPTMPQSFCIWPSRILYFFG